MADLINESVPVPNADYNGLYGWQHVRSAKISVAELDIKEPLNVGQGFLYNDGKNDCISAFNNRNTANSPAVGTTPDSVPLIPLARPANEEWELEPFVSNAGTYSGFSATNGIITPSANTGATAKCFFKFTIQATQQADVGKVISVALYNNAGVIGQTAQEATLPALGTTITRTQVSVLPVQASGDELKLRYTSATGVQQLLCTEAKLIITN
jgi:hypothetical protein